MGADQILQSLRLMAWERAKGELRSIGHGSYSSGENMMRFIDCLDDFIERIEKEDLLSIGCEITPP